MKIYPFGLAFAVASFAQNPTGTAEVAESVQVTAIETSATPAISNLPEDAFPIPGPGPVIVTNVASTELVTTATESAVPATTQPEVPEVSAKPQYEDLFTIRIDRDHKRLVTEDEMWHYKETGKSYMDITNVQSLDSMSSPAQEERKVTPFATKVSHIRIVEKMARYLSKGVMQTNIDVLSSFYNRYYNSEHGQRSSEWLLTQVDRIVQASGADNITVKPVPHKFLQKSIIVIIPGMTDRKIILGAHQDSINMTDRRGGRAPGADDNASGTAVLLEALRALLTNNVITTGDAPNTIEFHWYAGEEAGLLGSLDIFRDYFDVHEDVKAMLNFDMIGFNQKKSDKDTSSIIGVGEDYIVTDPFLSEYVKMLISNYTSATASSVRCGFACSDHASAALAGYPAAFVSKSSLEGANPSIHKALDTMTTVDMESVLEHARLALAFAYEMGMHDFDTEQVGQAASRQESDPAPEKQTDPEPSTEAEPESQSDSELVSTLDEESNSSSETDSDF
ncbi:aminopeptidase [Pyricularia oryzae 70-15]|uniref:Peptide hydrolase n=1 Tax=Pyricularia oryzae (strain 70-15 / ATCC MYA-4617 / FGSC 8958) TaxID=242507 RepID=G4N0F4_PYRO7|nr:aminopeptidase [Pyricularia oryzae 70-15]EHA52288.1 aminopeptidase [Pyricularia oryzae 70-15]KAI7913458.1 aminopeptidase [Pyricularia oryzae]KAI7914621.1 aminopeptidase [Pyricularia oryzae]